MTCKFSIADSSLFPVKLTYNVINIYILHVIRENHSDVVDLVFLCNPPMV